MKNLKAIVFDLNGLFVKPIEQGIIKKYCSASGFGKWLALSNYALLIIDFERGKLSPKEFWKKVFPQLTDKDYSEFVEKEYEKWVPRNEGLYSLCGRLSKKYALYCLSNSNFLQGKSCRKQKLYAPFKAFFLSHETGFLKPFPGAFTNFLSKTGLKAKECVFIDDSTPNVLSAMALGFKALVYQDNESLEKKLEELGILK